MLLICTCKLLQRHLCFYPNLCCGCLKIRPLVPLCALAWVVCVTGICQHSTTNFRVSMNICSATQSCNLLQISHISYTDGLKKMSLLWVAACLMDTHLYANIRSDFQHSLSLPFISWKHFLFCTKRGFKLHKPDTACKNVICLLWGFCYLLLILVCTCVMSSTYVSSSFACVICLSSYICCSSWNLNQPSNHAEKMPATSVNLLIIYSQYFEVCWHCQMN